MQFLFLILFNLCMGAVMYLVISLKLERSATEFRQRKLRKEMDEIIREFNVTAERNISILENRIKAMRRLLEKSGDLKSLDVVIEDADTTAGQAQTLQQSSRQSEWEAEAAMTETIARWAGAGEGDSVDGRSAKKGLLLFIEKAIDILAFKKKKIHGQYFDADPINKDSGLVESDSTPAEAGASRYEEKYPLEKNLTGIAPAVEKDDGGRALLSEEEVLRIISSAKDKYSMVSMLHKSGCAIEDISHYSGIPIGEVRLVLNLNNSL